LRFAKQLPINGPLTLCQVRGAVQKNIELMNKGLHITKKGLAQIRKINSNVNSKRTIFNDRSIRK